MSKQGDFGEQRLARAKDIRDGRGDHKHGFEHGRAKVAPKSLEFSLIREVAMTGLLTSMIGPPRKPRDRISGPYGRPTRGSLARRVTACRIASIAARFAPAAVPVTRESLRPTRYAGRWRRMPLRLKAFFVTNGGYLDAVLPHDD